MSQTVDYRVSWAFSLHGCIKGDATEHTKGCLSTGWAGWVTSGPKKHSILQFHIPPKHLFPPFILPSFPVNTEQNLYEPSCELNNLLPAFNSDAHSAFVSFRCYCYSLVRKTASVFFHHRLAFLKRKFWLRLMMLSGDSANYSAWLVLSIIFWVRKEGMTLWICLDWVKLWLLWASVFVSRAWA